MKKGGDGIRNKFLYITYYAAKNLLLFIFAGMIVWLFLTGISKISLSMGLMMFSICIAILFTGLFAGLLLIAMIDHGADCIFKRFALSDKKQNDIHDGF